MSDVSTFTTQTRSLTPVGEHRAPAGPLRRIARSRLPGLIGLLVAGLMATVHGPAQASDKRDQDRARAAVMAGEILPLNVVLERLQRTHPGQVLEVELERDDGRWIYEIKLLQAQGRLLKIELDARTAAVLEVRQRDGDRARSEKGSSR